MYLIATSKVLSDIKKKSEKQRQKTTVCIRSQNPFTWIFDFTDREKGSS